MSDKTVILNVGWLIDGSGTPAQPAMRIRLQNGILRSIRKSTEAGPDSVKPGQSVLDLSACTLIPALVDSHVHLALPDIARQDRIDIDTSGESHRICRQINTIYISMLPEGLWLCAMAGMRKTACCAAGIIKISKGFRFN